MTGVAPTRRGRKFPCRTWTFGDSTTAGLLANGSGTTLGWPVSLPPTIPVENFAVPSMPMWQIARECDRRLNGGFYAGSFYQPSQVYVLGGINDNISSTSARNDVMSYYALTFSYMIAKSIPYYGITMLPVGGTGIRDDVGRMALNAQATAMWGLVGGTGGSGGTVSGVAGTYTIPANLHTFIDAESMKDPGTGWLYPQYVLPDLIHLSPAGEQAMANLMAPYMAPGA